MRYFESFKTLLCKYPLRFALLFFGVLIPFLVFGKIAVEIRHGIPFSWDVSTLNAVHAHASPRKDEWVARATIAGGVLAVPFLLAIIFGFRFLKQPQNAAFFALAVIGAYVLDLIAKAFFHRPRPALWLSVAPETNYSFPSGHSMVSMAMVVAFIAIAWPTRWRWPVFVVAATSTLLIGLSRLYLGVHYPSDVLGGWCGALLWVCGLLLILKRSKPAPIAD
jgi:membrane-associated phospholipid phosphatase